MSLCFNRSKVLYKRWTNNDICSKEENV